MTLSDKVVARYLQAAKAKRVDVKIVGWKGARKAPKKDIEAFRKDVLTISEAGFMVTYQGPTVQLKDKDLSKLTPILKKHGLRIEGKPSTPKTYIGPQDR